MNALAAAQYKHDNRLPAPVSESAQELTRSEWLYNEAERLVNFGSAQGVKRAEFDLAIDEHVNKRLADGEVNTSALGILVLIAHHGHADKKAVAELLGPSNHPLGMLGEIAERLLEPLADKALIAMAEDDV